jgi:dTDP-glucose 4,6-dehydratase
MAIAFHKSFDLPVTIVRPFNTYGPRQSARAIIPTIITQIISGNLNLSLGAINTYRDFSYIDDTVNGFVAALSNNSAIGSVINLGSGFDISIADTAMLIAKLMGVEIRIHLDESRVRPPLSEVMKLCSDNSLAHSLLNWRPKYTGEEGLMIGLKKTITWFSIEENIKKYKSGIYNI